MYSWHYREFHFGNIRISKTENDIKDNNSVQLKANLIIFQEIKLYKGMQANPLTYTSDHRNQVFLLFSRKPNKD